MRKLEYKRKLIFHKKESKYYKLFYEDNSKFYNTLLNNSDNRYNNLTDLFNDIEYKEDITYKSLYYYFTTMLEEAKVCENLRYDNLYAQKIGKYWYIINTNID
jgi:hypothetical protein